MQNNDQNVSRKVTSKQVVAWIGIIVLCLIYIVTLIVAFTDNTEKNVYFRICLIATFTIPLLIWIYIWLYGIVTKKDTIADLKTPEQKAVREEADKIRFQMALEKNTTEDTSSESTDEEN